MFDTFLSLKFTITRIEYTNRQLPRLHQGFAFSLDAHLARNGKDILTNQSITQSCEAHNAIYDRPTQL